MSLKKEEYTQKMQAQVKELSAKIEQWQAKADQAEAHAKMEYQKHLEALREKEAVLRAKVQEAQQSKDEAWETLKSGVDRAWNDLKTAIQETATKFK